MKKLLFIFLALSFSILQINAQSEQIVWEKDFKKAQTLALETGKPLLLDFTAPWCKPCQKMEKEFWVLDEVVQALKPFIAVKVDFDKEKGLAGRYGVSGIPYVGFTDPLGNLITYRLGFMQKNVKELHLIFNEMPKDFTSLKKAYAALEANKNDGSALLEIADSYRVSKMLTLSNEYYKRALKSDEIKSKPETLERITLMLGYNAYAVKDDKQALKSFEDYLEKYPAGKSREIVLAMSSIANVRLEKLKEAEKFQQLLTKEFPNSKHSATVAETIENFKNKPKEKKK